MAEKRVNLSLRHIDRGEEGLEAALHLFKNKFFADAMSRAYYAAYHGAMAMLLSVGSDPKTHKGVVNQFYILFVEPGHVAEELGRKFARMLNSRMEADYGIIPIVSEEDVSEAIDVATELLQIAKNWLNTKK